MKNKLLKENQDKVRKFTKLLRDKLVDEGCHQAYVNGLSDHQILKDFRHCADCEELLYTPEQQMQAILEFEGAERAFDVLYGNLEGHDDLDGVEDPFINDCDDIEEDSDEDIEIVRGKWIIDGCSNLAETIASAQEFVNYLLDLREQGYELTGPVEDDYGILEKNDA